MMFGDTLAQKKAISFRRLYLETVSTGTLDYRTAWQLAKLLNSALWFSREIVATIIILVGVFALTLPFGSEALPWYIRMPFLLLSLITGFVGSFLILVPFHFIRIMNWVSSILILPLSAGLCSMIVALCMVIYRDAFGVELSFTFVEVTLRVLPVLIVTFGIGAAISPYTAKRLMGRRGGQVNLAELIDHSKRGKLVSISAQDHYVLVTTTAGVEMLRMTLSAAISHVEPGIGLQIHRSHWVAYSAISELKEQQRKVILVDGSSLPISAQHLPILNLELSRKDLMSQQSLLFERDVAEVDFLSRLLKMNEDSRRALDRMFLEAFRGKPLTEMQRLRIAVQIWRHSSSAPAYLLAQSALFVALASLGTYGLYSLPWYQPPLFWLLGYMMCGVATVPTHVAIWYVDLKFGSKGWLGVVLHSLIEGTLASVILFTLAYVLFGPVTVPFLTFCVIACFVHFCHAPVLHLSIWGYQSFASWKKILNIPPLLLQIPYEARGEIISISADKRTVTITTTGGQSTIKKRFKDALLLLDDKPGVQVHRSHWVARGFIKGRKIKGTANFVELTTGDLIPLAAANVEKVDDVLRMSGERMVA